jgi:hypothetical protein
MFKVVAFKRKRGDSVSLGYDREEARNEEKLDNNFSRARSMVLQYALCNPWQYFFTGTIDPARFDRLDIDSYMSRLSQFVRDRRKAYGVKFDVLIVPEKHKDGHYHCHGLINGLPASAVRPFRPPEPYKLIEGGFLNWEDYQEKFGFCSLAVIRDPVATAYYVSKYIGKDLNQRSSELGKHLYFHSRPLKKAEPVSDIYAYNKQLEDYCINDYDFCKVGMVEGAPWYFPYQWEGVEEIPFDDLFPVEVLPSDPLADFDSSSIEPDYEQLNVKGWR